jgi:hypothetical protein
MGGLGNQLFQIFAIHENKLENNILLILVEEYYIVKK